MRGMKRFRVEPGKRFKLRDFDPSDTSAFDGGKKDAAAENLRLQKRLGELQEVLYADHQQRVLIVLQGMDTSGKDGTIRHVMSDCSPQGIQVVSFKRPTEQELDEMHHFAHTECFIANSVKTKVTVEK